METYWGILERVRGSSLRLTKLDDDIYDHLKKDFPDFDPAETIDEDNMKSKEGKERWRNFMMAYDKKVDDYNFGTLLRSSPKADYGQHTTIFGKSVPLLVRPLGIGRFPHLAAFQQASIGDGSTSPDALLEPFVRCSSSVTADVSTSEGSLRA